MGRVRKSRPICTVWNLNWVMEVWQNLARGVSGCSFFCLMELSLWHGENREDSGREPVEKGDPEVKQNAEEEWDNRGTEQFGLCPWPWPWPCLGTDRRRAKLAVKAELRRWRGCSLKTREQKKKEGSWGRNSILYLPHLGFSTYSRLLVQLHNSLVFPLEARVRKGSFDNLCFKPNSFVVLDFQGVSLCLLKWACITGTK